MSITELTFSVPGKPFGKQRPRAKRSGGAYTPPETVRYENLVKVCFRDKYPDHAPVEELPIEMHIYAEFPIPTSWSKKKKELALNGWIRPGAPDWDNVGKIISDALNLVCYHDDKQVYLCSVEKAYGAKPRVDVTILY